MSAVTVAEASGDIAKMKRTGLPSRAAGPGGRFELVLHLHGERVLPSDEAAVRLARELTDRARTAGHEPSFAAIAIAATAGSRGLTILTRNPRHFAPLGIHAMDPVEELP